VSDLLLPPAGRRAKPAGALGSARFRLRVGQLAAMPCSPLFAVKPTEILPSKLKV
jgi:hypothetical protein